MLSVFQVLPYCTQLKMLDLSGNHIKNLSGLCDWLQTNTTLDSLTLMQTTPKIPNSECARLREVWEKTRPRIEGLLLQPGGQNIDFAAGGFTAEDAKLAQECEEALAIASMLD